MRQECNLLIHLLFWDSSRAPYSLQHLQKKKSMVSDQASVVAIQCYLFFRTNAVEKLS